MNIAEGVIAALLSPMHEDESIHCEQMRRLAARQIAAGVHGLFVAGTNGEAYALSPQEKLRLAESVLREAEGKVPVYFGSGLCGTRETIELSKEAQRLGVDALSIVCPYFAPVSQEGLYAHFSEIAAAVSLPIILYNIPARTGVNLAPATVARLAQIPNIIGVKDSSGNFEQILQYLESVPEGFHVLSGNDSLLLWTLMAGGSGGICGVANLFPQTMAAIYEAWKAGDLPRARQAQERIRPIRTLFRYGSSGPVIKLAANLLGLSAGPSRRPFDTIGEEGKTAILEMLNMQYRGIQ